MHTHDEDFEKPHVVHIYNYFFVLLALIILTGVTAWVAFFDFGSLNTFVAMAIAIFKTFLVCWIFMHLKWSPKMLWLIAGLGGIFFLIMALFTLGDFDAVGRRPHPQPWINNPLYPNSTAPYRHTLPPGAHGGGHADKPREASAPEAHGTAPAAHEPAHGTK